MACGHGICQKYPGRGLFFKPLVTEFFGAACKKGEESIQEGRQHLCLVQERKAENEECF
jgi:hypothetical protein